MSRRRFHLVTSACRRCGTSLVVGNRSLFGADAVKAELGSICSKCITPEEQARLEAAIAAAALSTMIGGRQ